MDPLLLTVGYLGQAMEVSISTNRVYTFCQVWLAQSTLPDVGSTQFSVSGSSFGPNAKEALEKRTQFSEPQN